MITTNSKIYFKEQTATPVIDAVQGDTGRNLRLETADYVIPSGAALTYYVQKPSGHAVYNSATRVDDKTVMVELSEQALAEAGECRVQIRVAYDEEVITSNKFILNVHPFDGEQAVESTSEMNVFDEAVANALAYLETAIDSTLSIQDKAADAKATGDAIAAATLSFSDPDNDGHIIITFGGT